VPAASDQRSSTRLAWTILPASAAGGTTVSNDLFAARRRHRHAGGDRRGRHRCHRRVAL